MANLTDIITPSNLLTLSDVATTTSVGVVERSTSAENIAGTDDTVYPTVLGAKEIVDTHGGAKVSLVASGAISSGDVVAITSAGKAIVVSDANDGPPSAGTPAVFESASANSFMGVCFDSAAGKVVIAYRDVGNSGHGTAVVGTVSGTGITFGTPVVFNAGATNYIDCTFDVGAGKVVIIYRDEGNTNDGTAIVGTVSGTAISFGTEVDFDTGTCFYTGITYDANAAKVVICYANASLVGKSYVGTVSGTSISFGAQAAWAATSFTYCDVAYDSTNNKVVVAYKLDSDTFGYAAVGTISGTGISWGTAVAFTAATLNNTGQVSIDYDSTNQKMVIVYTDSGNSDYGTAIVGTVSGTSISFGTEVAFNAVATESPTIVFDPDSAKMCITYANGSTSGITITGTVSGTSISFSTEATYESAHVNFPKVTYDTANDKAVVAYADLGNSSYGTAAVISVAGVNSNADEAIGFAAANISDTATGNVTVNGGVSTNQTGLTAGNQYYTDKDGALTTVDGGYPKMGIALSATELLVRGEV